MNLIEEYWLLILIVAVAAVAMAWYIFHAARRTRVTGERHDVLDEGAAPAARNQALIDAPATRAPPVSPAASAGAAGVGEAARAFPEPPPIAAARTDDLSRIKGVGPKLVGRLHTLGVTSFAQIAGWGEADIERIDAQLGRFRGRIRRDDWVEQAKLLAAGDDAGFAARFGAIS